MKYVRLLNEKLEYAKDAYTIGDKFVVHPTDDEYRSLGFKPFVDIVPEEHGYYPVFVGYEERETEIRSVYRMEELPPRNLSLSKRKLMNGLKAVGKWEIVKQWMQDNDAWDDWLMSTTLDEQDPLMQGAINALPSLGFTEQDIEGLLVNSEAR